MRIIGIIYGACIALWAVEGLAGDTCPPDPALHIDSIEHWTGATNINGAVGNGGLSVGVSLWGELSVLRWPSPSYYDHLNYTTVNEWPGYLCGTRMTQGAPGTYGLYNRPVVLSDNMGSFAGLYYFTATTPSGALKWFKDDDWSVEQTYLTDDSNVLVTTFTHDPLGLRATQQDFVLPDKDVLVRHYLIERRSGSPVTSASFIYYENLAPGLTKAEGVPIHLGDSENDFAVAYDSRKDALLHFLPKNKDLSILTPFLTRPKVPQSDIESFIDGLDGDGVYIAVGSQRASAGHQCGEDDFTPCPESLGWTNLPQGAFTNITTTGGVLSGSSLAGCQADAALSYPVTFDDFNSAEFTVYFALAGGPQEAFSLLEEARSPPYQDLLAKTEEYWKGWLSRAVLPKTVDSQVIRFCKRALVSIKMAQDRDSGAIVASISLQPDYGEDWSRDGSFINLALDMAGYHDLVTRHNLFYSRVQRTRTAMGGPAGSWASNYYADGMVGLIVPPFEIDETGLAVWTLVTHAKFIDDPCERQNYLGRVYPAVRSAAELLTACKDPTNNLQCFANEDDNPALTQTLHGATSTYLGLVSAVEAGRVMGEDRKLIDRWEARAKELKTAILSYYDPNQSRFAAYMDDGKSPSVLMPAQGGDTLTACATCRGRGGYWLIWPSRVLPYDDARIQAQAEYLYTQDILPNLLMKTDGFGYLNELALALTRAWQGRPEMEDRILDAVRIFFHDVPTQGTNHMGEVEVVGDFDADGIPEFQNRVAMPHVWKQTINYLLAMAAFNPEAFDRVEAPLTGGACLKDRGWGCAYSSLGGVKIRTTSAAVILVPLIVILVLKRRL